LAVKAVNGATRPSRATPDCANSHCDLRTGSAAGGSLSVTRMPITEGAGRQGRQGARSVLNKLPPTLRQDGMIAAYCDSLEGVSASLLVRFRSDSQSPSPVPSRLVSSARTSPPRGGRARAGPACRTGCILIRLHLGSPRETAVRLASNPQIHDDSRGASGPGFLCPARWIRAPQWLPPIPTEMERARR
jgi:hypothetical protein